MTAETDNVTEVVTEIDEMKDTEVPHDKSRIDLPEGPGTTLVTELVAREAESAILETSRAKIHGDKDPPRRETVTEGTKTRTRGKEAGAEASLHAESVDKVKFTHL